MSIQQNKIRAIIEKIWSKVKEPKAMSGDGIVDAIDDVYEAGEKAQREKFWDDLISDRTVSNGKLKANMMFSNWTKSMFYPTRDIVPYTISQMFYAFGSNDSDGKPLDLKARLEECGVKLDFSGTMGSVAYLFGTSYISNLPIIDFSGASSKVNGVFTNSKVENIEKLIVKDGTCFTERCFTNCTNLYHVIIEVVDNGKITQDVDFSYSPLDVESMKSIILHLYDYSETTNNKVYSFLVPETSWEALEADSTSPTGTTWKEYVDSLGYLT